MRQNNLLAAAAVLSLLIARTASAEVHIDGARAELGADAGRAEIYFTLRNDTGHALKLQKIVSPLAASVEFRQRSFGADGRPQVWPVAKLEVATGASLTLSADGRFFQASGLAAPLRGGQTLTLTLTFEDEPPVTLQVPVVTAR